MGTLRKKTIKGNIYYYYVESKRMDGKPKNVNQKYLGTAEALLKLKNQASAPLQDEALYSHIKSYGDVVLLYDLFARLGIVDIMGLPPKTFSSQSFWSNTAVSLRQMEAMEDDILALIDGGDMPFHYVGGLKKNQCEALLAVDKSRFTPLEGDGLEGQSTYRESGFEAYGQKATAIVVDNPKLREGQVQGVMRDMADASNRLEELSKRLLARSNGDVRRGRAPTVESVTDSAKGILSKEFMARVFWFRVTSRKQAVNGKEKDFPLLEFGTNTSVLNEIIDRELGKTVLFTDRGDLTDGQIVTAYRNAWYVEHGFRQMKDTSHLSVRPLFHWKDERIKVHIFICVLAFRLCSLLRMELDRKGIHASIDAILDEMGKIKTVDTFFGDPDRPTRVQTFPRGSTWQKRSLKPII
ncbi:MAG: hypothetical protein VB088_05150 [Sphaerochaeta sp.]|nr:hypothetical protein [Sphaerochaeta sp.]